MLGKTIYIVSGLRDFDEVVRKYYFDTQHEAEAFRDKAADESQHTNISWYVEAQHIYTRSDDAIRSVRA